MKLVTLGCVVRLQRSKQLRWRIFCCFLVFFFFCWLWFHFTTANLPINRRLIQGSRCVFCVCYATFASSLHKLPINGDFVCVCVYLTANGRCWHTDCVLALFSFPSHSSQRESIKSNPFGGRYIGRGSHPLSRSSCASIDQSNFPDDRPAQCRKCCAEIMLPWCGMIAAWWIPHRCGRIHLALVSAPCCAYGGAANKDFTRGGWSLKKKPFSAFFPLWIEFGMVNLWWRLLSFDLLTCGVWRARLLPLGKYGNRLEGFVAWSLS